MTCKKCGMPVGNYGIDSCFCPLIPQNPEIPEHLQDRVIRHGRLYRYITVQGDFWIKADDTYRFLDIGEVVQEGDEFVNAYDGYAWWSVHPDRYGVVIDSGHVPHRRKL